MLEEDVRWLLKMQNENLDLRKPKKFNKMIEEINKNPSIFIRDNKGIIGHAKMQRIGRLIELHTVVINNHLRGQGHSHKLIYSAWERWSQDMILHGKSLGEKINFKTLKKNKKMLLPCQMIAFTRSASLASSLISAGFRLAIPKRKWWSLWLIKSQFSEIPINQLFYLLVNRLLVFIGLLTGEPVNKKRLKRGFIKRFFQKRRRLMHQLSNLNDYKLFILPTEMQVKEWPRKGGPNEEYYHPLNEMKVTNFTKKNENSTEKIKHWDSGDFE